MAKKTNTDKEPIRKRPPSRTPEGRENRLVALAMDLVEKRLMEGTASSQETTHFLKLGTTTHKIEKEILEQQKELITAKTESLKSNKVIEELYTLAINAMKSYSGHGGDEEIIEDNESY